MEHNRTKELERTLLLRGVDYCNFISGAAHFDLEESYVRIDSDVHRVAARGVSVKKQVEVGQRILSNPLKGKYVLAISSFPSDLRAKQLAIMIMRNAIQSMKINKLKGDYPLWHKLYGNFKDSLRDSDVDNKASMLILSNINNESSAVKIEKLRDILEKYTNVPRIVVFGGDDPISFFANRLHYPLTAGVCLGPENRIRDV